MLRIIVQMVSCSVVLFIAGCLDYNNESDISNQFTGDYIYNSYTYFWDVTNGGRYVYGPTDCVGSISSSGKNILSIHCYEGTYELKIEPDGSIIHETCEVKIGNIDKSGISFTISSNPCNEPGHRLGGYWYKRITGYRK